MKILVGAVIGLLLWPGFGFPLVSAGAAEIETSPSRQTLFLGQQIYEVNCAVCHGVKGDGNGSAASMFRIQPRDFRNGIFKFRSTASNSLPTDEDLLRTITQGVRWTGMIGRPDLGDDDRKAVIQYIKTFSPRFMKEKPERPIEVPEAPEKTQQILDQGKRLYKEVGCNDCHGEQGRGDGPSAGGLKDDWGWPTWPSDLTWRPLKRGSDTRETYLTLASGLSGTPMPSYADSLSSRELWALVYYLESLVPSDRRLDPNQVLGEEQQGWMALRMGGMMGGGGMMGPGMRPRSR
ncbi:MAG: c-type cytochrome [Candidatus Binatia bacterium]